MYSFKKIPLGNISDLQSRTLNLGHTALVPAFLSSNVVV